MLDPNIATDSQTVDDDLPSVLLPYQQDWMADTAQLKVYEKSRRIGVSWDEAADDVLIAASDKAAGGQNVYYVGYNQDMSIEFIEACAMWAKSFNYAASEMEEGLWDEDGEDKHIKTYTIKFPESGHRIVALSSRPANLRGKQGVIVIDEAAFHDKLPELLKAAMAMLIWGGKVRVISTHNGDGHAFNELVTEIKNGSRKGSIHRTTFAQAVDQGLYRRVCIRLGIEWTKQSQLDWVKSVYDFYGEDAVEELDVIPKAGSGSYIPSILIEKGMVDAPVLQLAFKDEFSLLAPHLRELEVDDWIKEHLDPLLDGLDKNVIHGYGWDYARSGDLSVFAPISTNKNLVRTIPFLLEIRNCPVAQQRQILWHCIRKLPNFAAGLMDATGNGETIAEDAGEEFGTNIVSVKLNDAYYGANMTHLKSGFEDGLLRIPRHADVRRDLRSISLQNGIPKLNKDAKYKGSDGKKRHGDAAIAIFLAYLETLADIEIFAYDVVKPHDVDLEDDSINFKNMRGLL